MYSMYVCTLPPVTWHLAIEYEADSLLFLLAPDSLHPPVTYILCIYNNLGGVLGTMHAPPPAMSGLVWG